MHVYFNGVTGQEILRKKLLDDKSYILFRTLALTTTPKEATC